MNAEIITIGDEILIGQIVDTNSQWIGKELNKIGVSVYQVTTIQDERQHILNALHEAQHRVDIVVITGGLGPTKDDITKKTLAEYFNDHEFVDYPEVVEHIKKLFKKINHPFSDAQLEQAKLPSKATYLKNSYGTAPGMWFYESETVFVSLPGVPYEMKGLLTNEVLPRIQAQFQLPYIIHSTIMTYGQGESIVAERISEVESSLPNHIKLAYLPSFGKVRLRLSAKGNNKQVLSKELKKIIYEIQHLIADIIVGLEDGFTIEKRVGELLIAQNKTLVTAESLTGGKIASNLVAIPGSSKYFKGSFVVYSTEAKQNLLGISKETMDTYSVVSKEVAAEMATMARDKMTTDFAIAVTGNAGPTTDNTDKTLGDVFIALATKNDVIVKDFNFGQPREKVINRTVSKALEILQVELLKNN